MAFSLKSLFSTAHLDAFNSEAVLRKYAKTLLPCAYDDFVAEAKTVLTHEDRNSLRRLLDVRIKRHSRYNLSNERLTLIEKQIASSVKGILD